ncbi:hypothetical protein F5984_08010 [Rudanella paleaurantiibacter]|uniref:Uncharacterized protein n=1 Tax=Rudanella paleaurantiibacter TaxID=2614655 RepID=A0A7J5U2W5_9BACT|nr:hypothetical protein [Rudanella paleaurantiibacter]KAB7732144.1 hypothetical protein F5984_08010 [Rudanella paleaurantiibacter]
MQRQLIHGAILLFGLSFILASCWNEPDFDETPKIEYFGMSPFRRLPARPVVGGGERDSVIISVKFTDGDGDLGENTPRNKADSAVVAERYKDGWGNYEIKTFRFVNGRFEAFDLPENRFLLFPRLTREGQRGAIEGTLDLRQVFFYTRNAQILPVKFQIRIRDRALRVSNTIETDTIRVPILAR